MSQFTDDEEGSQSELTLYNPHHSLASPAKDAGQARELEGLTRRLGGSLRGSATSLRALLVALALVLSFLLGQFTGRYTHSNQPNALGSLHARDACADRSTVHHTGIDTATSATDGGSASRIGRLSFISGGEEAQSGTQGDAVQLTQDQTAPSSHMAPVSAPVSTLPFRVIIVVMAYNRPSALRRALDSLRKAHYGTPGLKKNVLLRISIDHYPLNPPPSVLRRLDLGHAGREQWLRAAQQKFFDVLGIAEEFEWPYGDKEINVRTVNGGTQGAWLQAWYPTSDDEYCFFMEDDLVVSPDFYLYLSMMVARYAYGLPPEHVVEPLFGTTYHAISTTRLKELMAQASVDHEKALKRLANEPRRGRHRLQALSSSPASSHFLGFPYSIMEDKSQQGSAGPPSHSNPTRDTIESSIKLFGISLQRQYLVPGLNAQTNTPIPDRSERMGRQLTDTGEFLYVPPDPRQPHPFLYQEVGTWGQLMFPKPWREFVRYYERIRSDGSQPALPGTIAEQWAKEVGTSSMWTPFHQRWAFETQSFTVYANLPFGLALSDSMRDRGVTISEDLGPSARIAKASELTGEGSAKCHCADQSPSCVPGDHAWIIPPLVLLERYDMCFRRVPHGQPPSTALPIDCSSYGY